MEQSYFTLPQSLSSTSNTAGHTTFANLTAEGNLTNTLDNTPFVTVFVPTNEAFSAAGTNATKATSSADLISNHVVQDFLGYLPALTDGLVLKSRAGQILTVSVRSGQYYVNGAKITTSNLILENGVAHVVDKVKLIFFSERTVFRPQLALIQAILLQIFLTLSLDFFLICSYD